MGYRDHGTRRHLHHGFADARRRGVVLAYVLLAIVFLTLPCFVFLVYNTGHQLQRKVETQNAADAAAISGAGQVARSLNLAAMNNLETLRLLTIVQLLDSMPQSTGYALQEQQFMLDAARSFQADPLPGNPWLRTGLQEVEVDLQDQILRLEELQELFTRYPIQQATYFERPDNGEKGDLWKAMDSLQALSTAAMEEVGELAQFSALRAAEESQSAGSAAGFLVPFVPTLPIDAEASFEDFRRPFMEGRLPQRLETAAALEFTRGPWDTLYGWREYAYNTTEFSNSDASRREGYASGLELFNPFNNPRRLKGNVIAYTTQSAFERFSNLLLQASVDAFGVSSGYDRDFAGNRETWIRSWFYAHAIGLARKKANLLFGEGEDGRVPFPDTGYVAVGTAEDGSVQGRWITRYEEAVFQLPQITIELNDGLSVARPLYLWLEFEEVTANESWQPQATPQLLAWGIYPFRARLSDWYIRPKVNEADPDAPFVNVGSSGAVTRAEARTPATDDSPATVRYLYFIWCGLQVGPPVDPPNPNPPFTTPREQLPKPVLFNQALLMPDNATHRRNLLTFLAAAQQPASAPLAGALFDDDRPSSGPVALAQAVVFNTHSWDGFTPMWHAQLTDVENLDGWLDTMQATGILIEDIPFLDADRIGEVFRYLRAAEPLLTEVNRQ